MVAVVKSKSWEGKTMQYIRLFNNIDQARAHVHTTYGFLEPSGQIYSFAGTKTLYFPTWDENGWYTSVYITTDVSADKEVAAAMDFTEVNKS